VKNPDYRNGNSRSDRIGVGSNVRIGTQKCQQKGMYFPVCTSYKKDIESNGTAILRRRRPDKPKPPSLKTCKVGKFHVTIGKKPLVNAKVKALSRAIKLLRRKGNSIPCNLCVSTFNSFNEDEVGESLLSRIKKYIEGTYVYQTSRIGISIGNDTYRITNPSRRLIGHFVRTLPYNATSMAKREFFSLARFLAC